MEYYKHQFSILRPPTLYISNNNSNNGNYNRLQSEVYRLKVPEFRGREGWLCLYSNGPWLLKCLTDVFPYYLRLFHCFEDVEIELPEIPPHGFDFPFKFLISTRYKKQGADYYYFVLLIDAKGKRMAYCDSKHKKMNSFIWFEVFIGTHKITCNYDDVLIVGDCFYFVLSEGCLVYCFLFGYDYPKVLSFHLHSNICRRVSSNSFGKSLSSSSFVTRRRYLVKNFDDRFGSPFIFVIRYLEWECLDDYYYSCKTTQFHVFDVNTGKTLGSLEDKSIFLARYDSKTVAASKVKCEPNCIYFVDDGLEGVSLSSECDFGVFHLKTKTIQRFRNAPFNRWVFLNDFA